MSAQDIISGLAKDGIELTKRDQAWVDEQVALEINLIEIDGLIACLPKDKEIIKRALNLAKDNGYKFNFKSSKPAKWRKVEELWSMSRKEMEDSLTPVQYCLHLERSAAKPISAD